MTLDCYVKDLILSLLLSLLIEPITNMPLPLNVNVCPIVGVVSVSLCLSVTFRREKRNQVNQYYAENVFLSLSLDLFIPSSSLSLIIFTWSFISHSLGFYFNNLVIIIIIIIIILFITPPPLLFILKVFISSPSKHHVAF